MKGNLKCTEVIYEIDCNGMCDEMWCRVGKCILKLDEMQYELFWNGIWGEMQSDMWWHAMHSDEVWVKVW